MKVFRTTVIVLLTLYSSVLWAQEEYYDQKGQHEIAFQNEAQIRPFIQEYVEKLGDGIPVKIEGEKIFAPDILLGFYKQRDYAPAWKDYDALRDAFELAMRKEGEAKENYARLAQKADSPELKDLFLMLRDEEENHERLITRRTSIRNARL